MVNFSAGGVMVYQVNELEKIIESGLDITANLNIDSSSFDVKVQLSWRKTYDNVLFVGFNFIDIPGHVQNALNILALSHE